MEEEQVSNQEPSQETEVKRAPPRSETKRYSEIFREFDNLDLSLIPCSAEDLLADIDSQSLCDSVTADGSELDQHDESFEEATCPQMRSEAGEGNEADGCSSAQEADLTLCRCEDGVETALQYAKMWCRYAKDLLAWMEKRINLEQEFAKNVIKTAEGAKANVVHQEMMPLQYIYTMALEQDIKNSVTSRKTSDLIQHRCYQALAAKKNEIDKWRREFKEQWSREQRRMNEAVTAFKKAQQQYFQRCEDLEKAKAVSARAVDDTAGIKTLDKRRKSKDEAQTKVMEAELLYRQCVNDARSHQDNLVRVKERIVAHIRKLICQGDTVLKEATVNMFYYQRQQTEPVPLSYHSLELTCRTLEPGEPYLLYVLSRRRPEQPQQVFHFQDYVPQSKGNKRKPSGGVGSLQDSSPVMEESPYRRSSDTRRTGHSDGESFGGSLESLSSPATGHCNRRLPKSASTLTVSSDDLDERDIPLESDYVDAQPVKARTLSRAALTHRLRKMKSKMGKCKQCDNYIVVSGVECEECGVALHRKCMEVCQLECENRKGSVFGVDISLLTRDGPDRVPFVVLRCTSEIESRALSVQGVYRVSGSKPRIQKLYQAFETQKEQVDLSDLSPHDITSILKQFFKELPEPLLTFDLYSDFISAGRTIQHLSEREQTPDTNEIMDIIHNLQKLLQKLPPCCYSTLQHVTSHLQKVSENCENKMSQSNLGIVFGPTLLRPLVSTDMSMVALLETSYQSVLVEFLITHHHAIFGLQPRPCTPPPPAPTAPLPETPPRAPRPQDGEVCDGPERERSSRERPRSLESRTIKRESSEGYISDKSSSSEAVDQLGANDRAVVAMTAASADSPDEPDSDLVTQPRSRFSRQPVKYQRHQNVGTRHSNPEAAARPPADPARRRRGSAESSRSPSPKPGVNPGVPNPHVPNPREVVQYMLGLDSSAATQEETARCRAHLNTNTSNNGQKARTGQAGPAQKVLSGLKPRRSHSSGKDEQLFV